MTSVDTSSVQAAMEDLKKGVAEVFTSTEYRKYLDTMAKFHDYSPTNCLLIRIQNPNASMVAGYQSWKKNFHRQVQKGEQGMKIFAPVPYKGKVRKRNDQGQIEEEEVDKLAFRLATVFDVSQTDGEPLPTIVHELSGQIQDYEKVKNAIIAAAPCPVQFADIPGDTHGFYNIPKNAITIKEGMSEQQTIKTMIHEITHATLHNADAQKAVPVTREQAEVEAESTAYVVFRALGVDIGQDSLDSGQYSFGYVAGWASDKDVKELTGSLSKIQKTAHKIITNIEAELGKDIEVPREKAKNQKLEKKGQDVSL